MKEDEFLVQLNVQATQRENELLQEPLSAAHCQDDLEAVVEETQAISKEAGVYGIKASPNLELWP